MLREGLDAFGFFFKQVRFGGERSFRLKKTCRLRKAHLKTGLVDVVLEASSGPMICTAARACGGGVALSMSVTLQELHGEKRDIAFFSLSRGAKYYCFAIRVHAAVRAFSNNQNLSPGSYESTLEPTNNICVTIHTIHLCSVFIRDRSTPVAQLAPRNLLTRWDVSSIPANGIFLTKN